MTKRLLIGIDLGTTVLKVCVFQGRTGRLEAYAERRLPILGLDAGASEQDPGAVLSAFHGAMREVRVKTGAAWRGVEGVGLAAQGGSSIIADRFTGEALTSMVLWNDRRSSAHLQRLAAEKPPRYWRRHLLAETPPHGLARLRWRREQDPSLFAPHHFHAGAGEFLFFHLTHRWRQDPGNAFQAGSYNAAKQRLDRHPFDLSGLPLSFVAPLRKGHETAPLSPEAAQRFGLREGLPVAGPYIDQEAAYLCAASGMQRPLQCSLGTAWVGNFTLPEATPDGSPCQIVLPSPTGTGCLVVLPLLAGNLTWDWTLRTFLAKRPSLAFRRAAAVFAQRLVPSAGLVVFPWFTLPNPFARTAPGGGAIVGLSAGTDPQDLVRATAAGMTYEFARVFGALKSAHAVEGLVLGGGAARGVYFRQLIAALFAPLPVFWQRDGDLAAARGAIYALEPEAARPKLDPVTLPRAEAAESILEGFAHYCATLGRIYDAPPGGPPFKLHGDHNT
jgi:sugar (pentulose or hexulose) kinase